MSFFIIFVAKNKRENGRRVNHNREDLEGWQGIFVDFFYTVVSSTKTVFKLDDTFATELSRRSWPGDNYSACVLDVAVGHVDLCLGSFWVTPQRMLWSHFLPPVSIDEFFFISPADEDDLSLSSILSLPFRPFKLEVWILVLVYGTCAAVILYACEHGHKNVRVFSPKHEYVAHVCNALFMSYDGLFGGQRRAPASVPARIASLGFNLVATLLLAAYTAHLAGKSN